MAEQTSSAPDTFDPKALFGLADVLGIAHPDTIPSGPEPTFVDAVMTIPAPSEFTAALIGDVIKIKSAIKLKGASEPTEKLVKEEHPTPLRRQAAQETPEETPEEEAGSAKPEIGPAQLAVITVDEDGILSAGTELQVIAISADPKVITVTDAVNKGWDAALEDDTQIKLVGTLDELILFLELAEMTLGEFEKIPTAKNMPETLKDAVEEALAESQQEPEELEGPESEGEEETQRHLPGRHNQDLHGHKATYAKAMVAHDNAQGAHQAAADAHKKKASNAPSLTKKANDASATAIREEAASTGEGFIGATMKAGHFSNQAMTESSMNNHARAASAHQAAARFHGEASRELGVRQAHPEFKQWQEEKLAYSPREGSRRPGGRGQPRTPELAGVAASLDESSEMWEERPSTYLDTGSSVVDFRSFDDYLNENLPVLELWAQRRGMNLSQIQLRIILQDAYEKGLIDTELNVVEEVPE